MKIVKCGSEPLSNEEFQATRAVTENLVFADRIREGTQKSIETQARQAYIKHPTSFVSPTKLKPLKIVVNPSNGATEAEFTRIEHATDQTLPNCISNLLVSENHVKTADLLRQVSAKFAMAFDDDFLPGGICDWIFNCGPSYKRA